MCDPEAIKRFKLRIQSTSWTITLWAIWNWKNRLIHATGDDIETIKNDDIFPGIQRMAKLWILALLVPSYRFSLARTSNLNDEFRAVSEIGHNEIYGADLDSAVPSTKSGDLVSEIKEKVDCFLDSLSAVFKIGMNSGFVSKEGFGCKIESHGNQVLGSKAGELELWSEVLMSSSTTTSKNGKEERLALAHQLPTFINRFLERWDSLHTSILKQTPPSGTIYLMMKESCCRYAAKVTEGHYCEYLIPLNEESLGT
nr:hypothetical protein [Tanacetum cinerariifolium]